MSRRGRRDRTGNVRFGYHGRRGSDERLDELVAVYAATYDVPPYRGDPFFSADAHRARMRAAMDMPGFGTLVAAVDGMTAGYVYGVTLPADRAWWASLGDARPMAARAAADAGRILWLRELLVLPGYRGLGLGRQLHDRMTGQRPEPWVTLTCIPDNQPAHAAYLRWGYQILGRIRHTPESPVYDAMLLPPSWEPRPARPGEVSMPPPDPVPDSLEEP